MQDNRIYLILFIDLYILVVFYYYLFAECYYIKKINSTKIQFFVTVYFIFRIDHSYRVYLTHQIKTIKKAINKINTLSPRFSTPKKLKLLFSFTPVFF